MHSLFFMNCFHFFFNSSTVSFIDTAEQDSSIDWKVILSENDRLTESADSVLSKLNWILMKLWVIFYIRCSKYDKELLNKADHWQLVKYKAEMNEEQLFI